MRRTGPLLLIALCSLTFASCSAHFWEGFAQGLAAYNQNSYSSDQSSSVNSETLCVKYKRSSGWSNGYQINATVIKGSERNKATHTFNYNTYSTYVVIFWDQGEASILELDYYYGSISVYGHAATDQQGRQWQVSKTSYCF